VTARRARLIAVDGVNSRALVASAQKIATQSGAARGISRWDASGLFEQLLVADDVSTVSPRLLLLLYAADLAFRLRWEIEPVLAEGRHVVAAPYVETAVAFGRACGLERKWLNNLFRFARKPSARHVVRTAAGAARSSAGFVEFACAQLERRDRRLARDLASRTRKHFSAR